MIEKHYGRFMPDNEEAQLALLAATVTPADRENRDPSTVRSRFQANFPYEMEWSQRESNPTPTRGPRTAKTLETQVPQGLAALLRSGDGFPESPENALKNPENRQPLTVWQGGRVHERRGERAARNLHRVQPLG
jgi:hypothetical protein